jgi:hypothetical protein
MIDSNKHFISKLIYITILVSLINTLAVAQIPDVPVAFPSNFSCTPGQLLYRQEGMGRITNIVYHNGHIYTNNVDAGTPREFLFADITDPSSLFLNADTGLISLSDQGNHGHTKFGDYASGYFHVGYGRVGVGVNDVNAVPADWISYQDQPRPDGSESHRIYYPWSVPFNSTQYGPSPATARLYRADQLLSEWEPMADHGIAGNSILLGNILFIIADGSMLGVAAYDISPVFQDPPQEPVLIDRLNGMIGGYIGAIWQDYLILSGGANRDLLQIIDISDVTNMRLIKTFDLTGDSELNAGTSVPYVQTQDQFVFTRRHKIDMELLEIVLEFDEVGNNRPAGSVSGQIDVSQYNLPLGNLIISGGYSAPGRDAIGVWCHQATPDTKAPYVGYHIPRDGQNNFPLGAPISLVIAEELESFTIIDDVSLIVRPVGGATIETWNSFSHDGILTITPKQYLLADTTYEVIIPQGGIKDVSGNGIEAYSFSFSTGSTVSGTNTSPNISNFSSYQSPSEISDSVTFDVIATDSELDDLEYRFIFADGTPATIWSSTASISHTFNESGHYNVKAQVRDIKPDGSSSVVSATVTQTVITATTLNAPQHTSMLALDRNNSQIWTVNPDNASVSIIDRTTESVINEINLSTLLGTSEKLTPVGVSVDNTGHAWIVERDSNQIIIIDAAGQLVQQIPTGYGSRPQSVLSSEDGMTVYVAIGSRGDNNKHNGLVIKYNSSTRVEMARLELGPLPRAMALTGDGTRLFVAEFLASNNYGKIWNIDTSTMLANADIILHRDRGLDGIDAGGSDGPGVPNYISSLVISPDHQWLWYGAIKTDTFRGDFFQQGSEINIAATHDSTIRSMLGRIDLSLNPPAEPEFIGFSNTPSRVDVDNSDSPSSILFNSTGDYAFITLQGNNTLAAFDDFAIRLQTGGSSLWRASTGSAPQASLFDEASQKIWVKNLLSRNLSIIDVGPFLQSGSFQLNTTTISTVQNEQLSTDVLAGKQLFYFAGDSITGQNEMSSEGYISCASCHIDGSHDGRVWDFSQRGEGFRNTTDLRGRRGVGHGNVHWSANFDEVQDFVLDMVNHFGGNGFLSDSSSPNPSLGLSNAQSIELNQISEYVTSLNHSSIPKSPFRETDGSMSASAISGSLTFQSIGCDSCHNPLNDFNNSELGANPQLHNVGTLRSSSGQRLGGQLNGIDTPTLLGVWETAPYFHDGSATTIEDVFNTSGGQIIQAETGSLSGGANIPSYIQFNYDSSAHAEFVSLPGSVSLSTIDGGSGGISALELRVMNESDTFTQDIDIIVNGITHTHSLATVEARLDWRLIRINDVQLNPGTDNTIVIQHSGNRNILIDEIMVSTSDDILLSQPHRVASELSFNDLNNLVDYLNQLDGTDSSFQTNDVIFANGFE